MGAKESTLSFTAKTTSIIKDYVIEDKKLGVGRSGYIISCRSKRENQKQYALKILSYRVIKLNE